MITSRPDLILGFKDTSRVTVKSRHRPDAVVSQTGPQRSFVIVCSLPAPLIYSDEAYSSDWELRVTRCMPAMRGRTPHFPLPSVICHFQRGGESTEPRVRHPGVVESHSESLAVCHYRGISNDVSIRDLVIGTPGCYRPHQSRRAGDSGAGGNFGLAEA